MNLQQAVKYHSTVTLNGWQLTPPTGKWVSKVSRGDWKRQDSFIVNRSFGLVKRLFLTPADNRIPVEYGLVQTPDGQTYIVESENVNVRFNRPYSYSYQLRAAPFSARLYKMVPGPALPSGMPGNEVEQDLYITPCDIERFGTLGSSEFDDVRYTQMSVLLPGNLTSVDNDTLIEIDGVVYNVREVYENVKELVALCVKRGKPQ